MSVLSYLYNKIESKRKERCQQLRPLILHSLKKRLGDDYTVSSVICNNCNAAIMLHELQQPFKSPFVNLWIPPSDYLFLLKNFQSMVVADFEDVSNSYPDVNYPVGLLGGKVVIHFMHYKTFDEAVQIWRRRAQRIDYENLRVMMIERDGTTLEHLRQFDALPFKYKVVLTHEAHPELKSCFALKHCTDKSNQQIMHPYLFTGWKGKRYYDQFDWVKFLFDK